MSVTIRSVERKGWIPDQPDDRDKLYHEEHEVLSPDKIEKFPKKYNLFDNDPAIYNQLQLGGCTGNGVGRCMEYQANKQGLGMVTPSRLFIYGNARKIEGTYGSDAGAQIRDAIKGVVEWGAPPETLWPYSDANPGPFNQPIPESVYTAASKDLAIQYSKIVVGVPGAPLRTAIYNGTPVVFGFSVPSYFEDGSWDPATQALWLPDKGASFIGGHCVVVIGYDYTCTTYSMPVFIIDNSWGMAWGMSGRFAMDARYFTPAEGLASDLWVIEAVS